MDRWKGQRILNKVIIQPAQLFESCQSAFCFYSIAGTKIDIELNPLPSVSKTSPGELFCNMLSMDIYLGSGRCVHCVVYVCVSFLLLLLPFPPFPPFSIPHYRYQPPLVSFCSPFSPLFITSAHLAKKKNRRAFPPPGDPGQECPKNNSHSMIDIPIHPL